MVFNRIGSAARRFLRHFARPVRADRGAEGLVVEPYRGFGNQHEIYLVGRVYRQPLGRPQSAAVAGDLRASLSRLLRRGAPGQALTARFAGAEQRVVTDRDGYFHVHLTLAQTPHAHRLWHRVALTLHLPSGAEASARASVFVPPEQARFVVISDIDDTVMYTGVANKAKMLWRLFAQGAESRAAFPGVGALYRALHGQARNPILYVSRAPWSIYSMLEAFFRLHRIPVGPVLFLREWGISLRSPLPRRAQDHKLKLVRDMLALYEGLPFVLIGDSGQHDPETYARIVREHPGRVQAIYIRNVSRRPTRAAAIEKLADEVLQADSSLLLAADSVVIAEHAAGLGLVPAQTPREVAEEIAATEGTAPQHRLRAVRRRTRRQTQRAVARGALDQALEGQNEEAQANTLVESEQARRKRRQ
jgi:phosphatidate phosphatase APP1